MSKVKFLLVADLHGSETVLNKTINAAKFYGIKNIIVAGDLTGKLLVPIIEIGNGQFTLNLFGETKVVDQTKLPEVRKQIRNSGYYCRIVTKSEYEELENSKEKVKQVFIEEMINDLQQFFAKAEERLKPQNARIYFVPGNDDYEEVAQYVESNAPEVIVPFDKKIVEFECGYQLVGYGYSNPTPWHTPRELPEEKIFSDLKQLMEKVDNKKALLVVHVPPIDTIIDKAPKLTADLKPVMVGGEYQMISVGSTSVRRIIEDYEPVAGLHGHIHESGGLDYVKGSRNGNKIPVFNPGSDYQAGILRGAIIELDDKKVKNYLFTRG
ncbi:hypothetical protein B9Q13_05975 [Candidatus Marsarchaeota G2 archaeon ECH_B_SAG-G16]|uniref:Uncharacterized protein n=4 Tax=Candidatus Marsarchaeota TaxID=1978152 RepID=A0A2R6AIG8_9ARCH|nr:MAG: hypothetical protein B9Q01_04460 [Candidatus Marsarchaeota G1 archaeon OSP_D]PSN86172.1 MAG: hypothetical protein B9Q02_03365 [Candidatus Marsarchaeota G1 archaeon BE_D]PSN88279.1 MAG: hypothetical protein B9Q00_06020 [Candidatus Marsarchaeota G1 archaeon OSP_C]PSO03932.1 MAG: hypothetical protein B9Q13_05975 [Candidatus Marsarchaeota G2 archaeon ECH_B_SAG-G16]